jgi:hypothetical protein
LNSIDEELDSGRVSHWEVCSRKVQP